MRVIHPGHDPGRDTSDRPPRRRRRSAGLAALTACLGVVVVLLAAALLVPLAPTTPALFPREPAFPPEAYPSPTWPPASPGASPTAPAETVGAPQRHPATLPSPVEAAVPAGPAENADACRIDDLSLVAHEPDTTPQRTGLRVTATNVTAAPCLIGGWPDIQVPGSGSVDVRQVSEGSGGVGGAPTPPARLVLGSGRSASVVITGIGATHDGTGGRTLGVALDGVERRVVPLPEGVDVAGHPVLEVGAWQPG